MKNAATASLLALGLALGASCGGSSSPGTPTPTPTTTLPARAGLLRGSYTLTVQPAAGCAAPRASFTMAVSAAPDSGGRYPGAQAIDAALPHLELELIDGASVRGSLATTELGTATGEGLRLWLRLVGTGTVTARSDGTGDVLDGTAAGDLEFGVDEDDEGGLGTCTSTAHAWTLRRR